MHYAFTPIFLIGLLSVLLGFSNSGADEAEADPSRNMSDWLDPKVPMLPRLLQQAGYLTGHFGKFLNPSVVF